LGGRLIDLDEVRDMYSFRAVVLPAISVFLSRPWTKISQEIKQLFLILEGIIPR
jgi:hypothetical protein